jgi:hypothetical protein
MALCSIPSLLGHGLYCSLHSYHPAVDSLYITANRSMAGAQLIQQALDESQNDIRVPLLVWQTTQLTSFGYLT